MAGLYGFYSRVPFPAAELRARLARMRSQMTSRATHRHVEHVGESGAIGSTGPGIFDGTITLFKTTDCRALVVDGEAYHVVDHYGRPAPGAAAWPVVQDALAAGGPRALNSIDGIYNGAQLATAPESSLTLFSDRYASRRLYYADLDDAFVFASELAPLAGWLGLAAEIDWAFVQDSLSFGSPIGDRTWLERVRLFPPATVATVTAGGVTMTRYWQWSDAPPAGAFAGADRFEQLHALWLGAIEARTSGRRIGIQLSGGLDSRLILGDVAARRPDVTTSTYGEAGADDVRFAERSARVAGVPWMFWPIPGANWLERRVAHSVAHDGIVDIVNAHHAGLVEALGRVTDVDISGYVGDATMGPTGLTMTPDSVLHHLPYWPSPVGVDPVTARDRVRSAAAQAPSPHAWMFENKWRRATNAWPHLAVNDLEVRKPFVDYALLDFCAGLPESDRLGPPQRHLLARFHPRLARVAWQKTGVAPIRGSLSVAAMRGVRAAYRGAARVAAAAGRPMAPWVRTSCDISTWCADPSIRRTVEDAVTRESSLLRSRFEMVDLTETIAQAFDRHALAIEVALNLYRAERVLQRLRADACQSHE